MDDGPTGHAMTEIALALAMSFFCLLVLALLSMRVPGSGEERRTETLAAAGAGAATMAPTDRLVIFHAGRFLDAARQPLDPAAFAGEARIVLAVDPALPMADVLTARRRIAAPDLVITPLDGAWLEALGAGDDR